MNITLNADMGEGFGMYTMGNDEGLVQYIDLANVACGFHAGDFMTMDKTIRLAKSHGVKVGAHPSLPDLQGFGRREMALEPEELKNCIIYQVGALCGYLKMYNMPLNHIKPHGKLYGMMTKNEALCRAVCEVALKFNVPLMGMKNTLHESIAKSMGLDFIEEFFSDLDYDDKGNLLITRIHDEPQIDEVKAKVKLAITEGKVKSKNGVVSTTGCESICVHSDTKKAIEIAKSLCVMVKNYNKEKVV